MTLVDLGKGSATLANNPDGNSGKSGFGLYVHFLMASRGITNQKALLELLEGIDYKVPAQNLSNWLSGTRPPERFLTALEEVLELSEEQKSELYRKYIYEVRV